MGDRLFAPDLPPQPSDAPLFAGRRPAVRVDRWKTYDPTWDAPSTSPSLGNGTLTGRYLRTPGLVVAVVSLVAGSTTTFGSGKFTFTLPVDRADVIGEVGVARAFDSDVTDNYAGAVLVDGSSPADQVQVATDQTGGVGGSHVWRSDTPFAWATGDTLQLTFHYEPA